jgi:hypothetical protein
MLAYIFWHRPYSNTERQRYEQAIVRFQNDLAGSKPPGFIGATSFQIEAVPWLSDLPGYEDWYLLDSTWAMDPLNAFAISGRVQASHDTVAAMMEQGHGGLYAHAGGESMPAEGRDRRGSRRECTSANTCERYKRFERRARFLPLCCPLENGAGLPMPI